ncbi:TPA: type III secretion system export apparatus subunit SctT [Yersinia enterocolitica]|nr:EscT/YscT/HrcT family type III secretion system export apparatus protein [Yersinia enterocolitica]HDL7731764.1 type III secretion system export apparatus subunit SctT [Yersinia enterocolitica]HDL8432423.1 type III secretion system export apparatus subunit SctT [Yersinia enterocolitica]HDL8477361.1 type III secretion system export apparatus subunit SctT [Yersinia enterocolitica]HDL8487540.1 type III secretion system export apparatus subunit SctT [Yersinia enterocolitica]
MDQQVVGLYVSLYSTFQTGLMTLALAWARIAPVFFFLPFLSSKLLNSGMIKNCVAVFLALGMWPFFSTYELNWEETSLGEMILYELAIGLVLAFILSLPFLIANIIGELIDNQRGATISDTIDPANGVESSEMSVLVSHIVVMIFLTQGGMYQLAQTFAESYRLLPFAAGFSHFDSLPLGRWLNQLVVQAIVLAAPILVSLFITEVALGLYSRFCPQLNAFSLSLTIKSAIAFMVFLLYFQNEVPTILINMISLSPLHDIFGVAPQ